MLLHRQVFKGLLGGLCMHKLRRQRRDSLPTIAESETNLTDQNLDVFTELIMYDDFGDFDGYQKVEYLSEIVDKVLKEDLDQQSESVLNRYSFGIKRNKRLQKNSEAGKLLSVTNNAMDDGTPSEYGTINENLVNKNMVEETSLFVTTDDLDEIDAVKRSLKNYQRVKIEFLRLEGFDLDMLLKRSLEGVPNAITSVQKLTKKYPFLGNIIEDILKAKEWGYDILNDNRGVN